MRHSPAEGDAPIPTVFGVNQDQPSPGVDDLAAIHIKVGPGSLKYFTPLWE